MPELSDTIIEKTTELEAELKKAGLWQKEMPMWVHGFNDDPNNGINNFSHWLQFVFVPNHLQKNKALPATEKYLIVPHALKYFGDDVQKGKLLRILIELDSLL